VLASFVFLAFFDEIFVAISLALVVAISLALVPTIPLRSVRSEIKDPRPALAFETA